MRHRQRVGLVVVAVAVLLVAVIAGRQPHLVAGVCQGVPVPHPPVIGDCVLPALPSPAVVGLLAADSGGTVPVYPAQQIQSCPGPRYGEVAAVIATPAATVVTPHSDGGSSLVDPNMDSCLLSAQQYIGITRTKPMYRFWFLSLQTTFLMARPSLRQEAAGQHWAACIVAPQFIDQSGDPTAQRYGSSIRNAIRTGHERDQLAVCAAALDWLGGEIGDCGRPHPLERLGSGNSGSHPVDRHQLELTCRQLVSQLTAMPDPTAGGALSVQIHAFDDKLTTITTAQIPAHSNLGCGIAATGNRRLRGSLLALGRQPIPWA